MSDRYDLAAIHERGVYALCTDDGSAEARAFVVQAERRGHRVERLPVEEACRRHRAFLATLPEFAGLITDD